MNDASLSPAAIAFRGRRQFIKRRTPKQWRRFKELKKNWWWRQKKFRDADKDHPAQGISFDFSDMTVSKNGDGVVADGQGFCLNTGLFAIISL